ncbi:uncharacterized protein F4812DRAFT_187933 [Daldinia caldariorum]|uniref:uncharacterized protein n=1 Tax=Daldinia caldariorum TaxID=326644 RepID=UPI002008BC84|nr:uncharacterized protein F4812DRAFT_187933 [Daldinia caldariorum]KAI1471659.1 hypothetical protein F4812DRAFT_187933 [Daldinia caldariorum]
MTDLGPLTTTFTPASGCNSILSGIVYTQTLPDGNTSTHKYHSLGPSATSECYPPGFEPESGFYSPGICPSGWWSACGTVDAIATVTETRATCCPLGYVCIQQPDPTETWSTLSCSSSAISSVSVTVPDLSNQLSKVTVMSGIIIHAAAINIRWQRGDFIASRTDAPTSSTLASSAFTSSATFVLPSSSNQTGDEDATTSNAPETGLSLGAKIGIGVGVGLGGLLMLSIGIGIWLWKINHPEEREQQGDTIINYPSDPGAPKTRAELWEQYQQEMQTASNTHELVTENNRHEITGMSQPVELPHESWR